MKITVKIEDVVVEIEREKFREGSLSIQDEESMKITIIPMLTEMVNKVKILYELKKPQPL